MPLHQIVFTGQQSNLNQSANSYFTSGI